MSEDRYTLNKEPAQMLKGCVIMDVPTPEQAGIAGTYAFHPELTGDSTVHDLFLDMIG